MSSSLSIDPSLQDLHSTRFPRLPIALIGPNEGRRRVMAEAIESSPQVDIFEFRSYPPKRGYLRAVLENPFSVAVLELDSDPEHALELIEEASECRGAAILAYSESADSKLPLQRMKSDSLAYCRLLFDAGALSEEINRIVSALCAIPPATGPDVSSTPATSCTSSDDEERIADNAPGALPDHTPSTLNRDFPDEGQSFPAQGASPDCDHVHSQEQISASASTDSSSSDSSSRPSWLAPEWIGADCELSGSKLQLNVTKRRQIRELDSAEIREADAALLQMFRQKMEKVQKVTKPNQKRKLLLPVSIAVVVLLMIILIASSHRDQLASLKAHILPSPEIKYLPQTSEAIKLPSPRH